MIFEKRYVFQGHVVGAAAHIRRFREKTVQMPQWFEGAAALPPTGGRVQSTSGHAEMKHPEHGVVMEFESASASVTGDFTDLEAAAAQTMGQQLHNRIPARVETSVELSTVDVQGVLKAKSLESTIVSEDPRNHGEVRFSTPRLNFNEVSIHGHLLDIEMDRELLSIQTRRILLEEYARDAKFREEYRERFLTAKPVSADSVQIPLIRGQAVVSVVKSIRFTGPDELGVKVEGHKVTVPDFGRIYFGELFIGAISRRLTLIRLQMGSEWGGCGSFCDSKPNGSDMP